MFFFFSNRLGCAGSIVVSVVATVLLIRSCAGYSTWSAMADGRFSVPLREA